MHFSGLEDISSLEDGIVGIRAGECTTAPCQEQQLQRELWNGYFPFSNCLLGVGISVQLFVDGKENTVAENK